MAGSKDVWICIFLTYIKIALWNLIILYSKHTLVSSHFYIASPIESSSYSVLKNYIQIYGLRRPLCACVLFSVQCAESWAHEANCLLCIFPEVTNELNLPHKCGASPLILCTQICKSETWCSLSSNPSLNEAMHPINSIIWTFLQT